MSVDLLDARDAVEALARLQNPVGQLPVAQVLTAVTDIYLAGLPYRHRIRTALKLMRPWPRQRGSR